MKRFFTLLIFTLFILEIKSQTTFSWRNDQNPTSGQWNVSNFWWDGSNPNLPGGGAILFLDGIVGTTMTNDLPNANRHKITFGSTNSPAARTINGSTENTFFEFGSTWPWIKNDATNIKHTINFPVKASSNSGFNLELIANAGALELSNTVNNNGRTIQIYGNNSSIDATNRFIRISGVLSGSGVLNVSQFGVVKLNAAHTYTGETQIDNGEIHIESSGSAVSSSTVYVGNGGQLTNTTKLWLANASGGTTFSNNVTINAGNYQKRYLGGLNTSGTHTFSGNITNNAGNISLSALSSGGTTAFTNAISGGGQVNIEGAGMVVLSGTNSYTGTTYVTGNLQLNKSGGTTILTSNSVTVDGASATLKISSDQTLSNLTLLNGANVTIDPSVTLTVTGTLALTNGKISLGTGNMVLGSSATITGASSSNYIVTNGAGKLTINNVTTAKTFPVGSSASSYSPVTITNTGTADNFSVSVGTTLSTPIVASKAVGLQWNISEGTVGGSNAMLVLQWPAASEGGSFVRGTGLNIGHHNGSTWDLTLATLSGSGPYTATASGFTSFSPFAVMNDVALSAELLSFGAITKGNNNILTWVTISEKNNAQFNIQRSSNNQAWQTIGSVKATNNSSGAQYNFTDDAPLSNVNYYRLQMVDNDGKTSYSKIIAVGADGGKKSLSVYPNPVKTELNVVTDDNTEGCLIYDMTGKMVLQFNDKRSIVNVAELPNGVYFLRLVDKNGLAGEPVRFVKQ